MFHHLSRGRHGHAQDLALRGETELDMAPRLKVLHENTLIILAVKRVLFWCPGYIFKCDDEQEWRLVLCLWLHIQQLSGRGDLSKSPQPLPLLLGTPLEEGSLSLNKTYNSN